MLWLCVGFLVVAAAISSRPEKVVVKQWMQVGNVEGVETLPGSFMVASTTTIRTGTVVVSVYGMPTVTLGSDVFLSDCGRRCKLEGKVEVVVGRRRR